MSAPGHTCTPDLSPPAIRSHSAIVNPCVQHSSAPIVTAPIVTIDDANALVRAVVNDAISYSLSVEAVDYPLSHVEKPTTGRGCKADAAEVEWNSGWWSSHAFTNDFAHSKTNQFMITQRALDFIQASGIFVSSLFTTMLMHLFSCYLIQIFLYN
jgi:hypothetical protein